MKMSTEDFDILQELCVQQNVDPQKVLKLLEKVKDFEFKERRAGINDELRDILKAAKATPPESSHE